MQNDVISIATVSGVDRISHIHINNLLKSHGIDALIGGSLAYGVSVEPKNAVRATKLLRADAPKTGYRVYLDGGWVGRAVPLRMIARHVAVASALREPTFVPSHALGRFLRSKELSKISTKYPYILSMSVRERRYLSTPRTYSTGYEVEIELVKSPEKKTWNYRGSYQVYDNGKSVFFYTSSESE